jgi:hypothetical protein
MVTFLLALLHFGSEVALYRTASVSSTGVIMPLIIACTFLYFIFNSQQKHSNDVCLDVGAASPLHERTDAASRKMSLYGRVKRQAEIHVKKSSFNKVKFT